MIVVHAALGMDGLVVWGERPRAIEGEPQGDRRRPAGATGPALTPYDAGASPLLDALRAAGLSARLTAETAVAWLPTLRDTPVASSGLIAEPPAAQAVPALRPWTVTTCVLGPAEAVDLLAACVDQRALASGVFGAPDLAFAASVMQFAGGLVVR